MLCCMPATRTQVYLTEEQRQRIDALAEAEGITMAEVVRRALDAYLDEENPDPRPCRWPPPSGPIRTGRFPSTG